MGNSGSKTNEMALKNNNYTAHYKGKAVKSKMEWGFRGIQWQKDSETDNVDVRDQV